MDEDSLESASPERLSRLLNVDGGGEGQAWDSADAKAALRHQLRVPLLPDLVNVAGAESERIAALVEEARGAGVVIFLEALVLDGAPLELLEGIKAFGRQIRKDAASPLCGVGGTVIYYAAIAAGLGRGARMTKLSDEELREGFTWARGQAGAEELRMVFEMARNKLIAP